MDRDEFDEIYKLLTEHNFDINENVSDKLKCVKCKKILINACQTRCGCLFCRNCVDEMMMNGYQVCPGITDDCKIRLLTNVVHDYRTNIKISKLILKCPEEMCLQECQLINMREHLRMCVKKSVKCPFYDMGCDEKKITSEMMNSHFQLENYNHSKILIEIIDNIKNEIVGLREKDRNHKEIEKVKENLKLKDERIESIIAEMELMKKEKMKLENRVKTLEEIVDNKIGEMEMKELKHQMKVSMKNIWNKIDEIDMDMSKRCENDKIESKINEDIKLIKTEKEELEKKMEISFGDLNRKMDEIIVEMRQARQTMKKEMMEMRNESRINQLEKLENCQKDGIFEMTISNVYEKMNEDEYIYSEYFYVNMQPYKLQLRVFPWELDSFTGLELIIRLLIYDDAMNTQCKWPFKADVTIKIINKNKLDANKSITKNCQIKRPAKNSFECSNAFKYSHLDLTKIGTLESYCIIVQCSFVFQL